MADLTSIETSTFAGLDADGLPAPDLDTVGAALSEPEALIEGMLRAVTEREGVLYWAPDKTLDLGELVQKGLTAADLQALESRIETLFEDEPRYQNLTATVSQFSDPRTGRMLLRVLMVGESASGVVAELQLDQDGQTLRFVRVN